DRVNCGDWVSSWGDGWGGSGCEVGVAGEVVEGGLVGAGCGAEPGGGGWGGVGEFGEGGGGEGVEGGGGERGVLACGGGGVGRAVGAGVGDAGEQSVLAEASQVVGHFSGGDVLGGDTEEGRDEGAQVTVGEPMG